MFRSMGEPVADNTSPFLVTQQGHPWIRKASVIITKKPVLLADSAPGGLLNATQPDWTPPLSGANIPYYVAAPEPAVIADGLDISEMHFRFQTTAGDWETPNSATIRIYNLADEVMRSIVAEYDQISISAGYVYSNFSIIFTGTIRAFRRGRENAVDSFLEIVAADNDLGYNFGFINTSLSEEQQNSTWLEIYRACAKEMRLVTDPESEGLLVKQSLQGMTFVPRGKVLYGLTRVVMGDLARSLDCNWSIQNGVLKLSQVKGLNPDEDRIVLSAQTGLVGVPDTTDNGIEARCLLNPQLRIGVLVEIDNNLIIETTLPGIGGTLPVGQAPTLNTSSHYRVLSVEHAGDNRGAEWYSNIVCLGVDLSILGGVSAVGVTK